MKRLTSVIAHYFQSFTDIDLEAESRKSGNGVKQNLFFSQKKQETGTKWHHQRSLNFGTTCTIEK